MEDASASIFDLGYRCEVLFCQTTSEPRLATAHSRLEELHQRFSAWVSYLGALAPGHASLDHRLRFSTEVRSMVVELLLLLRRNLLTVLDVRIADITAPLQALRGGMDRLYQVGVAIRKSSTVTLSSRIQAFSATHDDEDYFFSLAVEIVKWRFPDADAAICSHLAATIKFRRQKIRYQRRHQSKLRCGARRAAEQPSLSPAAPLLFGTPRIDARRQEELAGIKTVVQAPSQTSASTFLARDFLRHLNAPPSAPSDTQGTEPLSAPSMMSSGSTVIEYGNLSFPQPPAIQEGMSASCVWCFQEHMSEQYNDTRWWRRHVLSCLQPFACLSEECKEPPKLFSSEVDWRSHMTEAHGGEWPREMYSPSQWFCDVDHAEPLYFRHDQELAQHLRTAHSGTFNEEQIPTVLSQNILSAPRDSHVCPLCNCVPGRLSRLMAANLNPDVITPRVPKLIRGLAPSASDGKTTIPGSTPFRATRFSDDHGPGEVSTSVPSDSGESSSKHSSFNKELERHIARHLRNIAFISIRHLSSKDDAVSNASARGERSSRKSNLRTDDEASEPSALVFDDISPEDRESTEDVTVDSRPWTDLWEDTPAEAEASPFVELDSEAAGAIGKSAQNVKGEREPHIDDRRTEGVSLKEGQRAEDPRAAKPSRPDLQDIGMGPIEFISRRNTLPTFEGVLRGAVSGAVSMLSGFWATEMDVTMVGLQGCGKTSLLRVLAGGEFQIDSIPTIGFNMKRVQRGRMTIKFWDLGGQPRFRALWERYCRGVNAIVFVVDISDRELMPVAKEELHTLMGFPALAGIPLLVLGNHASRPDKLTVDELIDALELRKMTGREISCYGIDAKEETNLEAVLAWIMAR